MLYVTTKGPTDSLGTNQSNYQNFTLLILCVANPPANLFHQQRAAINYLFNKAYGQFVCSITMNRP